MPFKKKTNKILDDHGVWLLIDISTPKFHGATMAVDKDVFEQHTGGRIFAFICSTAKYIEARYNVRVDGVMKVRKFHREVIEIPDGLECDHIRHGTMTFIDNRRSNLRAVTISQNHMNSSIRSNNTSGVIGVCWNNRRGKWQARIAINQKQTHLGYFTDLEEAKEARKQAEIKYFGEYRNASV